MKKILLFVPFLLLSCVQYTFLGNSQRTYPINIEDVQIFENEKDLPIGYEKVAIISIENVDRYKYEDAKEKASEIGCNGILIKSYTKASFLGKLVVGESDEAEFIAIRFKVNGQYPQKRTNFKVRGDDLY